MITIGIVAEYNPFHAGHAWQIRESRRLVNGEETGVIAVMSGDYVQRGETAVFSKYARAEAACRSGADLVVELPLPWSISSAEYFAEGAVRLLAALGTDFISFGCEKWEDSDRENPESTEKHTDEAEGMEQRLRDMEELAELLLKKEFTDEVIRLLKEEPAMSFAAARQRCAENQLGRKLPILQQPNSILGLEYIKAIRKYHLNLNTIAVERRGAGHDEDGNHLYPSASELRKRLRNGYSIEQWTTPEAAAVFRHEMDKGYAVVKPEIQNRLMLSRLRWLREEDYMRLPDAGDGLGRRLYRAVRSETDYEGILKAVSSRRYPLSRIRHLCISAALGLWDCKTMDAPPYARVLAFNQRGRSILHRLTEGAGKNSVPVLVKPAHVHRLDTRAQETFRCNAEAHDFYTLFYSSDRCCICGEDWLRGPRVCS